MITDFKKRKLRKKAFIKVVADWSAFEGNYKNESNKDLVHQIITSKINTGTAEMLERNEKLSKRDFVVQLMSLPEYQLC